MVRKPTALLFLFGLTGCSGLGQVSDPTALTPEDLIAAEKVAIIQTGTLQPNQYKVLERVTGLSCQGTLRAPSPTADEAMEQLKIKAGKLRADAVTNIACRDSKTIDWANNCSRSIKCVGDAIAIVGEPPPASGTGLLRFLR
jgi:uncharacterized protein YbjQ (UPF0145 family)